MSTESQQNRLPNKKRGFFKKKFVIEEQLTLSKSILLKKVRRNAFEIR